MLHPRIIPCLLVRNKGLTKTVKFKDGKYVGDPINAVRIFNEKEVDELINNKSIVDEADVNEGILEPKFKKTLDIDEKMAVVITPSTKWQMDKSYELKDNYKSYLDSLKNSYKNAISFLDEKNISVINADDYFNIIIRTDSKIIDLRVGLLADSGYSLFLINPKVDFDDAREENIEKMYSKVFEK